MKLKTLVWIGSSKKDLLGFPEEVIDIFGYAIYLAQKGTRHEATKILKGFGSADVIEIIETDKAGTYRVVYTVKIKDMIIVLHAFQKKSKQGIATPKKEIDLVKNRLALAQQIYKETV